MNYRDMQWYDGPDTEMPPPEEPEHEARSTRGWTGAAVGAALVVAAVAIGWQVTRSDTSTRPSGAASSATSSTPSSSSSSVAPGPSGTGQQPSADAPMTLDAAAKGEATQKAHTFMTAFVAHKDDRAKWWAGVKPHLAPEAVEAMETIEPRRVSASKITASTRVMPGGIGEVVHVGVMTDVGEYDVELTRNVDAPEWRVNRVDPPTQAGDPAGDSP